MLKRDLTKAKVCGENAKRYPKLKPGEPCSMYSGMRKEKETEEHDCRDYPSVEEEFVYDDDYHYQISTCSICESKTTWKYLLVEVKNETTGKMYFELNVRRFPPIR